MLKKIVLFTGLILIMQIAWKQDASAKTWERHNTTISADSILAEIERGDSVIINSCRICAPLTKESSPEMAHTIKSLMGIFSSTFLGSISLRYCRFIEHVGLWSDKL